MIRLIGRIELRLAAAVSCGLLLFSFAAGFITYSSAFSEQMHQAAELQQQLVRTVRAQAEVAAFAANESIALGVVDGLLASAVIRGVRVTGGEGFVVERDFNALAGAGEVRSFTLYSPVDRVETIGAIEILQNDAHVESQARERARNHVIGMLLQLAFAVFIVFAVARVLVTQPVIRLAEGLAALHPESRERLPVEALHANDEIGRLTRSTNALLEAVEKAIDEVARQRDQLEILATHDQLTGLPHKRLAADRLQVAVFQAARAQTRVALLFIDLDAFKAVNDTWGHDAGDRVLKTVAQRLGDTLRESDTAARVGGDEFMVILPYVDDAAAAITVAEKLVLQLSAPMLIAGQSLTIGASIGVALYPEHGSDLDALRHKADQAMYAVKRGGRNGVALARS